MSKETYVGGDILEFIGGKDLSYAKGDIVNIGSQVIQNSKEGIVYGKPDFIKFDGDIDKEGPWLVLRSAKKKGRNDTDTATANDLLYGDYAENSSGLAKLKRELEQEFINVELDKKEKDTFPLIKPTDEFIRKEAEIFAQKRIDNFKPYLKKTNEQLFTIFEDDIKSWSMNDLEDVTVDIVGKVKKNTGGTYSHKVLTSAAKNHVGFVDFAYITEYCIADFISKGKKIEDLVITMDAKVDKGKLYKAITKEGAKRPVFNTVHDTLNGLRILVNDVWAYEVRVLRYRKMYTSLFIELEYTLYDHFGLDAPDIYKFDKEIFYVWFILQHFRGFKPLITKMKINREYPMIVPENWK